MHNRLLLGLIACAVLPGTATAQFCYRGRPRPDCATFLVSEFLVGSRNAESQYAETRLILQWEYGLMTNVSDRSALGGTVLGAVSGSGGRLAFKARYRRWLTPEWALDVAPGLVVVAGSGGQAADLRGPGFSGHLAIMWKDYAGVALVYEAIPFREALTEFTGTDATVGFGARLGSPVGGVIGAATFLGLLILGAHLASVTS